MIYTKDITTLKNTTKENPKKTVLKVTKGLVYRVEICLPPGPCGLLHIAIFDGGYQVWPYEYGESFSGDAETITFDDVYLKETEPFEFTILTYNEDDTFQHWCQIRIGLVSKEIFMGRFLPSIGFKELETVMTNILTAQEALRSGVTGKPLEWMTEAAE